MIGVNDTCCLRLLTVSSRRKHSTFLLGAEHMILVNIRVSWRSTQYLLALGPVCTACSITLIRHVRIPCSHLQPQRVFLVSHHRVLHHCCFCLARSSRPAFFVSPLVAWPLCIYLSLPIHFFPAQSALPAAVWPDANSAILTDLMLLSPGIS